MKKTATGSLAGLVVGDAYREEFNPLHLHVMAV
jgi:hypothetical protein